MQEIHERLDTLEGKIDRIIELLIPVNAHAPFVDDLKSACQTSMFLRRIVPVREEINLLLENNPNN